jgi:tRNA modification GTPase
MPADDTIFALSSGPPPAAVAVVRLCGPAARFGLETMIGRLPTPRRAALCTISDPETNLPLDQALALWFPAPHSETGEDMAELQLHGGRAVITATLKALSRLPGLRPAEPGEFTRRAFQNGRLDLTKVEGLADLIGAETEVQRRQAFRQLAGGLGDRAETWRRRLIEVLALVEAGIDFSDEGDVPQDLVAPALKTAAELRDEIAAVLAGAARGERLRDGLTVAIAGPPNVGKSSLYNVLARRDAAIVSPHPGTTRDVLELHLDLDGYPVTVLDTAGIRPAADPVEQEGVDRARARAAGADLVLWVVDASAQVPDASALSGEGDGTRWLVLNKLDLLDSHPERSLGPAVSALFSRVFWTSARTGEGVQEVLEGLARHAAAAFGGSEPALITRLRHRYALEQAHSALNRALAPDLAANEDLLAEELRAASVALGRLLGRVDVEDVLDVIFRDFCIGK